MQEEVENRTINLATVSYTHLDVYKRQPSGSDLAIAGTKTPYFLILSAVSIIASSSLTLKG